MTSKLITVSHLAENREAFTLIDVREPAEFAARHIDGAVNIPLSKITPQLISTEKTVVLSCLSGKRSMMALDKLPLILTALSLDGGLNAWVNAGFATKSNGRKRLPLDRQVQLTIGSGVLAGVLLSLVNPNFIWLSAFFGAGLMFAGATGFCGLARVMAIAPWNKA